MSTEKKKGSFELPVPYFRTFCNDSKEISVNDPNYKTPNNNYFTKIGNPKTLIPPVIAPRLAELDHWRANNLITNSHINSQSQYDNYLSGYDISTCCDKEEEPIGIITLLILILV